MLLGSPREAAAAVTVLTHQGSAGAAILLEATGGHSRAWALYGLGQLPAELVEEVAGGALPLRSGRPLNLCGKAVTVTGLPSPTINWRSDFFMSKRSTFDRLRTWLTARYMVGPLDDDRCRERQRPGQADPPRRASGRRGHDPLPGSTRFTRSSARLRKPTPPIGADKTDTMPLSGEPKACTA
jgi:hypothetical protein